MLRIATRASELALWQARHTAELLRTAHSGLEVELVPLSTEGDRRADVPLSSIGGKGVFATEVQQAVVRGDADIAVHSAKDLPALTPAELVIAAVPRRGDARDALVGARLGDLGTGDVVATGSARRRVQLAQLVPGIRFAELRGNMATRLERSAGFSAIVVAAVALERLGLADRLDEVLAADAMVPQVGQGTLAVECHSDDRDTAELLATIEHPESRRMLDCERAFLSELGGDCELPAGAHAVASAGSGIELTGILALHSTDGPAVRLERVTRSGSDPDELGRQVAAELTNALSH